MESFEEGQKERFEKAQQKSRTLGWFALTAQDHRDFHSSPSKDLIENEGKAQYEIMTDKEIEEYLDNALSNMYDPILIKNYYAATQKHFFTAGLPFLESVGRLPEKFKNFNLASLPELPEL